MGAPPATLAGHELVEELGRGGMGVVYRARHLATGAERALKLMLIASHPDELERFRREGEVLARVGGAGVVAVHETGSDRGRPYIVMALMRGGSLRDRLEEKAQLSWKEAAALVRQLALALERCHAAGVVHRDLKPENVLFDEEGRPHLTDFGCVRDLQAESLTATGTIVGTPTYMSPEQLDGKKVDARSDIYALGVILHELVNGRPPFPGTTPIEALMQRMRSAPPPLEGAPAALDALVRRALASRPAERFASAGELAARLGALEKEKEKEKGPLRKRLHFYLLAFFLGALALLASHGAPQPREPVEPAPVASPSRPQPPPPPQHEPENPAPLLPMSVDEIRERLMGKASIAAIETRLLASVASADSASRLRIASAAADRLRREKDAAGETLKNTPFDVATQRYREGRCAWRLVQAAGAEPDADAFAVLLDACARAEHHPYLPEVVLDAASLIDVFPAGPEQNGMLQDVFEGLLSRPENHPDREAMLVLLDAIIAKHPYPDLFFARGQLHAERWYGGHERLEVAALEKDFETFFATSGENEPRSRLAQAHFRVALIVAEDGRLEEALEHYDKADGLDGAEMRRTTPHSFDLYRACLLIGLWRNLDVAAAIVQKHAPTDPESQRMAAELVAGLRERPKDVARRKELLYTAWKLNAR
jgi:serine/threonine-protein kinase